MYYPLYEPKTMLHVLSFAAGYSPKKLLLQNNFLKDANSIYPLNKVELVYLDLRNNEVIVFLFSSSILYLMLFADIFIRRFGVLKTFHQFKTSVIRWKSNLCKL